MAENILSVGANIHTIVHVHPDGDGSLLHFAIKRLCSIDMINLLIRRGVSLENFIVRGLCLTWTPLQYAAWSCYNAIDALLQTSIDPTAQDENGNTALHILFISEQLNDPWYDREGQFLIMSVDPDEAKKKVIIARKHKAFILKADGFQIGYCLNGIDYVQHPVENKRILSILGKYRKGDAINDSVDRSLIYQYLHLLKISALLKALTAVIPINTKNKDDKTPLQKAILYCFSEDIIKLLIKNGADTSIIDIEGNTLLHYAARTSSLSIVKLLIANGADLYAVNKKQETPLFAATMLFLTSYRTPRLEGIIEYLVSISQNLNLAPAPDDLATVKQIKRLLAEEILTKADKAMTVNITKVLLPCLIRLGIAKEFINLPYTLKVIANSSGNQQLIEVLNQEMINNIRFYKNKYIIINFVKAHLVLHQGFRELPNTIPYYIEFAKKKNIYINQLEPCSAELTVLMLKCDLDTLIKNKIVVNIRFIVLKKLLAWI